MKSWDGVKIPRLVPRPGKKGPDACLSRSRVAFRLRSPDLTAPIAGAADGPLAGLTVAVKDMYDIAGYPTGGGSPDWLRSTPPAKTTARRCAACSMRARQSSARRSATNSSSASPAPMRITARPLNPRAPGGCPAALRADRHRRPLADRATSPWAATPAVRCACRPRFAASTASVPTHGRVDLTGAMPMAPVFRCRRMVRERAGAFPPPGRRDAAEPHGNSRGN